MTGSHFYKYQEEMWKARKDLTYEPPTRNWPPGWYSVSARCATNHQFVRGKRKQLRCDLCHSYMISDSVIQNKSSRNHRINWAQADTVTSSSFNKHLPNTIYEQHTTSRLTYSTHTPILLRGTTSRLPALSLASELSWSTASLDEDLSDI